MAAMNSSLILTLIGKKAAAARTSKKSASRVGSPLAESRHWADRSGGPQSGSFLHILRARLAKMRVLPKHKLRPASRPDRKAHGKGKASTSNEASEHFSGQADLGIGLVSMAEGEPSGATTHGTIREGRDWRTSEQSSSSERLFRANGKARKHDVINRSRLSKAPCRLTNNRASLDVYSTRRDSSPRLRNDGLTAARGVGRRAEVKMTRRASKASTKTWVKRRMSPFPGVKASSGHVSTQGPDKVVRAFGTLAAKTQARGMRANQSASDKTSRANRTEGRATQRVSAGKIGSRTARQASYQLEKSYHSSHKPFRQASVGIRRRVLRNEGHTQPHSRPSERRQNSYIPAKRSAARRWLPSKASRFWGRSESHHPSFRALGHPQRGDSRTSGLESSGRIPSLSKALRAKLALVGTRPMDDAGSKGQRPAANGQLATANRPSPKAGVRRPRSRVQVPSSKPKVVGSRLQASSHGVEVGGSRTSGLRVGAGGQAKLGDSGSLMKAISREAKPRRHQPIAGDERPAEVKGDRRSSVRATPHGKGAKSRGSSTVKSPAIHKSFLSKPGLDVLLKRRENVEAMKVESKHPRRSRPAENALRQDVPRRPEALRGNTAVKRMSSRSDSSVARADVKRPKPSGAKRHAFRPTDSAIKSEVASSLTRRPDARAEGRPISSDKPRAQLAPRRAVSENAGTPSNEPRPSVVRIPAARVETGGRHETSARAGAAPKVESSARPVDDAPHRPSRADVQPRMTPRSDSPGTHSDSKAAQPQPVARTEDSSNHYISKDESLSRTDREHRNPVRTLDERPRWTRAGKEGSTKAAARTTARPAEPVKSNSVARVVTSRATSGPALSHGLRDVLPLNAGIEGDARASSVQQWQEMFWSVPSDLPADDRSQGRFQTILTSPRALVSQVAARIRRLHQSARQEMRIRLHPPELGAMRIRIRVASDGVKATLMVEQPQAHALLEENMPALLRALQEQGLKVDSLSVEVSHGSDEFGLSSQSDGQGGERGRGSLRSSQPWREAVDETMLPAAAELSASRLLDVIA